MPHAAVEPTVGAYPDTADRTAVVIRWSTVLPMPLLPCAPPIRAASARPPRSAPRSPRRDRTRRVEWATHPLTDARRARGAPGPSLPAGTRRTPASYAPVQASQSGVRSDVTTKRYSPATGCAPAALRSSSARIWSALPRSARASSGRPSSRRRSLSQSRVRPSCHLFPRLSMHSQCLTVDS